MRILIVGAGIAGLTLVAKLLQQGRKPVVVERLSEYGHEGSVFWWIC
jgi:2-polyprenyl-6-methoxyphenol hydroxylase-like FAD-dependent oxidoreductase